MVQVFLDTDIFYSTELKSVYNKLFEGLVHWLDWKNKGDGIGIIRWDHIEDTNNCGRCCMNIKPTNRYNPGISGKEQAKG